MVPDTETSIGVIFYNLYRVF